MWRKINDSRSDEEFIIRNSTGIICHSKCAACLLEELRAATSLKEPRHKYGLNILSQATWGVKSKHAGWPSEKKSQKWLFTWFISSVDIVNKSLWSQSQVSILVQQSMVFVFFVNSRFRVKLNIKQHMFQYFVIKRLLIGNYLCFCLKTWTRSRCEQPKVM